MARESRPPAWSSNPVITVVVAEQSLVVRRGLVATLETSEVTEVVGETETLGGLRDLLADVHPTVALVALRLADAAREDVLDALTAAVDAGTPTRFIAVTDDTSDAAILGALVAGAGGFVLRDRAPDVLMHAVVAVDSGGVYLDPQIASVLVDLAAKGRRGLSRGPYGLTVQQRRVLALLPRELTNKQIAEELGISPNTVKAHLRDAMRKIGAHDRIEAARKVERDDLF